MIEAWIQSQNEEEARQFARHVQESCDVEAHIMCDLGHEPVVLNRIIDLCQSEFVWFLTPDVELIYPETPHIMAEWMKDHPTVGVLCPNREGEAPYTGGRWPFDKYLADNTAILYRKSVGAYFDPDFIFAGWNDLDFGNEVEYRGFTVQVDPRISVKKIFTAYGSWSSFRNAYNARNRLVLEAKWYWVGRDKWQGVDAYNRNCALEERIPGMFELSWWAEERLNAFTASVDHEHPQIRLTGGDDPGNLKWQMPV